MNQFGNNLSDILKKRKIRFCDFAADLDVSESSVHKYLSGQIYPKYEKFVRICNITNTSPNMLLDGLFYSNARDLKILAKVQAIIEKDENGRVSRFLNNMLDFTKNSEISTFGRRLTSTRVNVGVSSVNALATSSGITSPSLSNIENDKSKPSLIHLLCFCNILRVSPEYLLYSDLNPCVHTLGLCGQVTLRNLEIIIKATELYAAETLTQ